MRNYSPDYQFWVLRADLLMASKDSVSCTLEDGAIVEITPVDGRSVNIRIDRRWVGAAGVGVGLVGRLLQHFESKNYDVIACAVAMNTILDGYYPE